MTDPTGQIVRAAAGRDKGGLFYVVGVDGEGRLLLCDGKRRKLARPKAKKPRHVEPLPASGHPAAEKLRQGPPLSDKQLRRALAAFRDQLEV